MHVADPDHLWNKQLKEGYLQQEAYQNQALNVIKKHPNLNLTLAHFGFLSNQPDYVVSLFEKYPTLKFDIVPAIEEYFIIAKNPKIWREIFAKYFDRYMFGSDRGNHIADGITDEEFHKIYPTNSAPTQRKLFELDGIYDARSKWAGDTHPFGTELFGLNLPEQVVEDIFYNNFIKLFGAPKKIDYDLMAEYVRYEFSHVKLSKHHENDYLTLTNFLYDKGITV